MIGIRREDKNRWERRAPLTPEHVAELTRHGVGVAVEPSTIRVFSDEAYRAAGARVIDDLSACPLVLGVKEIPVERLKPGTAYFYFAHVTKGQPANMPMLRRLIELEATLVDYEKIADDRGRRLVFFGRHAGFAGMLDTLATLGKRLLWEGIDSPFASLRLAHDYADLEAAHAELARVADTIRRDGVPDALHPLVIGFTGSGNASKGAQEIFDQLPYEEVLPEDLSTMFANEDLPRNILYKVVFTRSDRFGAPMAAHLSHLTALVNGIYWERGHPRVASLDTLRGLFGGNGTPRLRVIGDISCDLAGSIEANVRTTTPGDPAYVYDIASGEAVSGVAGRGPVILAVDNLPCELPVDASQHFGDALLRFLPALSRCDWSQPFGALELQDEIRRAVIVHRGRLTPPYADLARHLA
jgi:Alanine dehydrogenase/PNT, N-terminal domain/Alanine dehydrogenase/PNT, C-terminal domain